MEESRDDRAARLLATGALDDVPALTDALVARILAENPAYSRAEAVPQSDLWQSCSTNLTRVLQLITLVGVPGAEDLRESYYDAARATGEARALQSVSLDDVLRSFRFGGRLVWEALVERGRAEPDVGAELLLELGTRVWEVVDATSAQVAAAYQAAERRLVRADEQRRAALWEGLLAGRAADPGYAAQVGQALALPVRGPYVVVAVDRHGVAAGSGRDEAALRHLEHTLAGGGLGSAWQARGEVLVGLVALGRSDVPTVVGTLRRRLDRPAGVSLVVSGLAEAGVGHAQAELALRTMTGSPSGVVALADRLPEALLLASPDLAGPLLRDWLGPVLALPASERDLLLDTLVAWLDTGGSAGRTAETVHCHRNTVVNRIHRLEVLTGQSLVDGVAPLEMVLALRAVGLPLAPPPSE